MLKLILQISCISLSVLSFPNAPRPIAKGEIREDKKLFLKEWETPNNIRDIRSKIVKYDAVVPVVGRRGKNSTKSFMEVREELFDYGVYPGVEYRILDIKDTSNSVSAQQSQSQSLSQSQSQYPSQQKVLTVRPVYPLIKELERDWPVEIPLSKIPFLLTRGMYNTITVLGSLSLAISFFISAFLLSTTFTFSVVNSRSMMPTILPKDIILVEKISPLFHRLFHQSVAETNEILFFTAPPQFKQYIQNNNDEYKARLQATTTTSTSTSMKSSRVSSSRGFSGSDTTTTTTSSSTSTMESVSSPINNKMSTNIMMVPPANAMNYLPPVQDSSLLIKRVNRILYTTSTMDVSTLSNTIINQQNTPILDNTQDNTIMSTNKVNSNIGNTGICLDMRGDNPPVSLDSRQWGCLDPNYVVGKPVIRIFPLSRIGLL